MREAKDFCWLYYKVMCVMMAGDQYRSNLLTDFHNKPTHITSFTFFTFSLCHHFACKMKK